MNAKFSLGKKIYTVKGLNYKQVYALLMAGQKLNIFISVFGKAIVQDTEQTTVLTIRDGSLHERVIPLS